MESLFRNDPERLNNKEYIFSLLNEVIVQKINIFGFECIKEYDELIVGRLYSDNYFKLCLDAERVNFDDKFTLSLESILNYAKMAIDQNNYILTQI